MVSIGPVCWFLHRPDAPRQPPSGCRESGLTRDWRPLGKPYNDELAWLSETYRWAMEVDCEPLTAAVRRATSMPLLAVGSGGSFTTADFAATAHRETTGFLSAAQTPLDAVTSAGYLRSTAVMLATAGGRNPDVLGCFRAIAAREPRCLVTLCLSVASPLAREVRKIPMADLIELAPPSGKDGFLATNSVLASAVLLLRAYSGATGGALQLPAKYSELGVAGDCDDRWKELWTRDTLVVLHGPSTRAAAIDLESKFTEAALGNVRAADYRHFAHGRHFWLAKRSETSAVVAFTTPDDELLASKTLALLPKSVPVARENISFRGLTAGVAALTRGFDMTNSAGRARGIDPGRPRVPSFGRRIYHIRAFPKAAGTAPSASIRSTSIERKAGRSVAALGRMSLLNVWYDAFEAFTARLHATQQRGVVLDYDGTICSEEDRFGGLTQEVQTELSRILRMGLALGIATGRGKSARTSLRDAIPRKLWDRVVIGYYNGGEVGLLSDDSPPDGAPMVGAPLQAVAEAVTSSPMLRRMATIELRLPQIRVAPVTGVAPDLVWEVVQSLVLGLGIRGVSVLRSGHSIDILAPGVDKHAVVRQVAAIVGETDDNSILRIGDQGRYPGNDYLLLNHCNALSVDSASSDPEVCWNLAPAGVNSVDACLYYLRHLKPCDGYAVLRPFTGTKRQAT